MKDQIINDLNNKMKYTVEEKDNKLKQFESMFSDAFQKNNNLQEEINMLNNEMNKMQKHYELEITKINEDYVIKLNKQNTDLQKYKKDSSLAIDHMQVDLYINISILKKSLKNLIRTMKNSNQKWTVCRR